MKYHLVPTKKKIPSAIDFDSRVQAVSLNREMLGFLKKLKKRDESNCDKLFYLYDDDSMQHLKNLLANPVDSLIGDEIIIHAEGMPFIISSSIFGGQYAISAFALARYLKKNILSGYPISINLLSCNSATDFMDSNFARDLSRALTFCFEYPHNRVIGYTGYISVKNNAKFAVSAVLGKSVKGSHASIEDANMIYAAGEEIHRGTQLITSLSDYGFDWAHEYITKMHIEREFVNAAIRRIARHPLFIPPTDLVTSKQDVDEVKSLTMLTNK